MNSFFRWMPIGILLTLTHVANAAPGSVEDVACRVCDQPIDADVLALAGKGDATAAALASQRFALLPDNEAWSLYEGNHEAAHRILFGDAGSSVAALSREELKAAIVRVRQANTGALDLELGDACFIASAVGTYLRDLDVDHWGACVTSHAEGGFFARSHRGTAAGTGSVFLTWAPGMFAGLAPTLSLTYVAPPGAILRSPPASIAVGTGVAFFLDLASPTDGYQMFVNGSVEGKGSYSTAVVFPRTTPPEQLVPTTPPASPDSDAGAVVTKPDAGASDAGATPDATTPDPNKIPDAGPQADAGTVVVSETPKDESDGGCSASPSTPFRATFAVPMALVALAALVRARRRAANR